jgi:hypothetical protein
MVQILQPKINASGHHCMNCTGKIWRLFNSFSSTAQIGQLEMNTTEPHYMRPGQWTWFDFFSRMAQIRQLKTIITELRCTGQRPWELPGSSWSMALIH